MSMDTAAETNNRADYTAIQFWGVFINEEESRRGDKPIYNIILLEAINERMEFPELKKRVFELYNLWEPDSCIVEKKSSGSALFQELRRTGVPVSEFTPGRGSDKIARVNAVADLFSSGIVWAPDRRWAREVIDQINDFPSGRNDDQCDAMTLAMLRFRQGGFIRIESDEPEALRMFKSQRRAAYY